MLHVSADNLFAYSNENFPSLELACTYRDEVTMFRNLCRHLRFTAYTKLMIFFARKFLCDCIKNLTSRHVLTSLLMRKRLKENRNFFLSLPLSLSLDACGAIKTKWKTIGIDHIMRCKGIFFEWFDSFTKWIFSSYISFFCSAVRSHSHQFLSHDWHSLSERLMKCFCWWQASEMCWLQIFEHKFCVCEGFTMWKLFACDPFFESVYVRLIEFDLLSTFCRGCGNYKWIWILFILLNQYF